MIERRIQDGRLETTAGEIAQATTGVREHETLEQALTLLVRERSGVPVFSSDGSHAIGWLSHRGALDAYVRRLTELGS